VVPGADTANKVEEVMIFIHEAPSGAGGPASYSISQLRDCSGHRPENEEVCAGCPNRWMCLGQ